jgi:YD repeat-containing protein
MIARALSLLATLLLLNPLPARADGAAKDGNFNIAFTDVVSSGGLEMKVERVYNSTTPFSGIFGFGWGTDFEKYLAFLDDGSIVVHEWGGGAENKFSPGSEVKLRSIGEIENLIMAAMEKEGFASEAERGAYRSSLAKSHQTEWNKLVNLGLLKPPDVPLGATFTSEKFGHQELVRVRDGYEIYLPTVVQTFDATSGHLVLERDMNGKSIAFRYAGGQLAEMSNGLGERFTFVFGPDGHVAEIVTAEGRKSEYHYSGSDLIDSIDVDNHHYSYSYDLNHNLTAIKFPDGTAQRIAYYPYSEDENVKRVVNRDGSVTDYTYVGQHTDHEKYTEQTTDAHGKVTSTKSAEYFMATAPNGTRYAQREVISVNGVSTETDRDANGYALRVTAGADVTIYAYDAQERVTLKQTPTTKTQTEYDSMSGKPSQVSITERTGTTVYRYTYDGRGNLLSATDGEHVLAVAHDDAGRMSAITSKGNPDRVFRIAYNRFGESFRFSIDGVGALTLLYDDAGDLKKVNGKVQDEITDAGGQNQPTDGDAGKKIDEQINAMFTVLQDVLKPSGSTIL